MQARFCKSTTATPPFRPVNVQLICSATYRAGSERPIAGFVGRPIETKRVQEDEYFKIGWRGHAPPLDGQLGIVVIAWVIAANFALDPASYARAHISYFGSAYFAAYHSTGARNKP